MEFHFLQIGTPIIDTTSKFPIGNLRVLHQSTSEKMGLAQRNPTSLEGNEQCMSGDAFG
jgi:hypothetical protein